MSAADWIGVAILGMGAAIAVSELVAAAWVALLPPIGSDDVCRERPSAIPAFREEQR